MKKKIGADESDAAFAKAFFSLLLWIFLYQLFISYNFFVTKVCWKRVSRLKKFDFWGIEELKLQGPLSELKYHTIVYLLIVTNCLLSGGYMSNIRFTKKRILVKCSL